MPNTFPYIQDPGHGWLLIHKDDLKKYGFSPSDFSRYSYISRDGICALEEDCDMEKFFTHLTDEGIAYNLAESHLNSDAPCRRWRRISP